LLEAGPPDDADEIRAPAALSRLFQTAYDWNYLTIPQHRAGGPHRLLAARQGPGRVQQH